MEFPEEYLRLALRYLRGDAGDTDKETLIRWIEADPKRKEDFAVLSALYKSSSVMKPGDELTSRMLFRLNARIDAEEKSSNRHNAWRKGRIFKIFRMSAASIAVTVAIGLLVHRFLVTPDSSEYTAYSNTTDDVTAIMLEDSSKVWLGAKSTIQCNTNSAYSERIVRLTGEAYFDVHRDTARPFIVRAGVLDVKVLGTAFCVKSDEASGKVSVLLERGSVRLQSPEGVGLVRLSPDQMAEFDSSTGDLAVEPMGAVPYIVQHYNKVTLQQATIGDIISHIERMYGVMISARTQMDNTKRYDLNYKRTDSARDLVETVQELTGADLVILGRDNKDTD